MQFHPIYFRSVLILSSPILASGLFSSALPTSNLHARPFSLLRVTCSAHLIPPSFDQSDNAGLHHIMFSLSISISISLTYTKTFRCCFSVHSTAIKGNYFSFLKKVLVKLQRSGSELKKIWYMGAGEWRAVGDGVSWKRRSLFEPEQLVSFSVAIQTSYVESRNNKPVNNVLRWSLM